MRGHAEARGKQPPTPSLPQEQPVTLEMHRNFVRAFETAIKIAHPNIENRTPHRAAQQQRTKCVIHDTTNQYCREGVTHHLNEMTQPGW